MHKKSVQSPQLDLLCAVLSGVFLPMIKDLRNTFKQTAIYGLSTIFVKATGLILLPIYTHSLSLSDYGMLTIFELITQFFVGVISFGLPASMLRVGSEFDDRAGQNRIYFTTLVMLLVFCGGFLAIFLPLRGIFSAVFFESTEFAPLFTLIFISCVTEILGLLPMQLLRLREKSGWYIFFFSLKLAALIGFVWYFVTVRNMGVYGALLGVLAANCVLLIATFGFQFKNLVFKFDRSAAIEMYRFGAPLIFTTISAILLTISDRLIIKIFGELSDVGVYSMAYKFGSLSNLLIIGSFALGYLPIAFKKFNDPNFKRFWSKMMTYFIGLTVVLTLFVSLFSKEGIKLVSSDNPDYWMAVILVPFIAYMFLFKALYNYMTYVFSLIKRTRFQAYVTIAGVVFNISLNFVFIPFYGMYGAIAATGISYIGMALLTYKMAQANYPVHYEFKRIAALMISCGIFIAIGIYFNDQSLTTRLLIKSALCLGFVIYIYFGVADDVEREKVGKVYRLLRKGDFRSIFKAP